MELKEFIEQTIIQITDGLRDGNKYIIDNNFGSGVKDTSYTNVKFDVAVTTGNEEKTGIGGKLSVANVFSFGGNEESALKSSNISRINFEISLHVKTKN